ncbi:MAG: hypothetical protein R3F11_19550 [Verrucomicrobiales bacterium]
MAGIPSLPSSATSPGSPAASSKGGHVRHDAMASSGLPPYFPGRFLRGQGKQFALEIATNAPSSPASPSETEGSTKASKTVDSSRDAAAREFARRRIEICAERLDEFDAASSASSSSDFFSPPPPQPRRAADH